MGQIKRGNLIRWYRIAWGLTRRTLYRCDASIYLRHRFHSATYSLALGLALHGNITPAGLGYQNKIMPYLKKQRCVIKSATSNDPHDEPAERTDTRAWRRSLIWCIVQARNLRQRFLVARTTRIEKGTLAQQTHERRKCSGV